MNAEWEMHSWLWYSHVSWLWNFCFSVRGEAVGISVLSWQPPEERPLGTRQLSICLLCQSLQGLSVLFGPAEFTVLGLAPSSSLMLLLNHEAVSHWSKRVSVRLKTDWMIVAVYSHAGSWLLKTGEMSKGDFLSSFIFKWVLERVLPSLLITWDLYHDGRWTKFSYRISFDLTKPNHSNPALLVPWCWSSPCFVNSGFDLEFVEHVHMNVWHHWRTANHEPWLKVLLKVKRLKNMVNLNAFTMKKVLVHERGQIKEMFLLSQCIHKWNLLSYFI